MSFLKNHPFAVEAFFERSVVLTFAVPKDQLAARIPECLELDTFQDQWAFIAVAMVQTKSLRPKGFPEFLGRNFFLIGYRIFVRLTTRAGKRLRGLYIIRSETDKGTMEFFGNLFTHYKYTTTDVTLSSVDNATTFASRKSNFNVTVKKLDGEKRLPAGSPFTDWKDARRFAGPLPFTFTWNAEDKEVLIIEGVRQNWNPEPVDVEHYEFRFLEGLHLHGLVLASTFEIRNIPYYWKKGRIEKWE